jgi:hypothetical protein
MRDDFVLIVPMYVAAKVNDDQTVKAPFLSSPMEGEYSTILFSEELLAERWSCAFSDDLDVTRLDNWGDVLDHLQSVPKFVTRVAIDPKAEIVTHNQRSLTPIVSRRCAIAYARRELAAVVE